MNDQASPVPKGWEVANLGEVGTTVTGKTPSHDNPNDWGDLIDFITPTDIVSDSKYIVSVARKLSEDGKNRFSKTIIPSGSVVVSCIGSDMGKVVINKHDALTNQQINSIKVNSNYDNNYIYYLLRNSHTILRNIAVGGSTMPILNKSTFESLSFPMPQYPEQQAIAVILSSLDDKIELLREQNKILEATAQAIFNEWFVNFNFPGATGKMIDSELEKVPEGWRFSKLGDEVNIVYGKNLPTERLTKSGYTVFGANGQIGFCDKYIYEKPQVLVSCRGEASGKVNISLPKSFVTNNSLVLEIANDSDLNFCFMKFFSLNNDYTNFVTGSAQPQITIDSLKNCDLLLPQKEVIDLFNKAVEPIDKKQLLNFYQIQTLSALRDTLLSKLMKGELRVKGFNN